MTLNEFTRLQSRAIYNACIDQDTRGYIMICLYYFNIGEYGNITDEQWRMNRAALNAGTGRIIARYEAQYKLDRDIAIVAQFENKTVSVMFYDEIGGGGNADINSCSN